MSQKHPRRENNRSAATIRGFAPIGTPHAHTLVLGTMPSVRSLEATQYYAHPRNAFWSIVEDLFGVARSAPYARRCEALTSRGIAVWDVLGACERPGSLDSAIREPVANDFGPFLPPAGCVRRVLLNGTKARDLFRRFVARDLDGVAIAVLPSTSPANAGTSYAGKLAAWRVLAD